MNNSEQKAQAGRLLENNSAYSLATRLLAVEKEKAMLEREIEELRREVGQSQQAQVGEDGEHDRLHETIELLTKKLVKLEQGQGEAETLTAICDLLGIGKKARNHSVIMACIGNIHRFSEMLHAVEHKFFMVTGETDEDYTPEERGEECLVNSWGSTKEQYLEQFERALDAIRTPAPAAVRFVAACSGLQYENPKACGQVSAVIVGEKRFDLPAPAAVPEQENE